MLGNFLTMRTIICRRKTYSTNFFICSSLLSALTFVFKLHITWRRINHIGSIRRAASVKPGTRLRSEGKRKTALNGKAKRAEPLDSPRSPIFFSPFLFPPLRSLVPGYLEFLSAIFQYLMLILKELALERIDFMSIFMLTFSEQLLSYLLLLAKWRDTRGCSVFTGRA